MKFGEVILISAVFLVISSMITYAVVINYNLNTDPEFASKYCQRKHESKNSMIPTCNGGWTYENRNCFFKCTVYDSDNKDKIMSSECRGLSIENIQKCCEEWASKNDIVKATCVGVWQLINDKCFWDCS